MAMRIFVISFLLILASCNEKKTDWGIAQKYFPNQELLLDGVVNKYYEHYTFNNDQAPLIRISYHQYQLVAPNILEVVEYGGGFNFEKRSIYRFDSSKQFLEKEQLYFNFDTLSTQIISNVQVNWEAPKASLNKIINYSEGEFKIERVQIQVENKLLADNRQGKVFDSEIRTDWKNGEFYDTIKSQDTYAENIGLFTQHVERKNVTVRSELIEQMSLKEFEKRKDHGIKRVGYIDLERRLDSDEFSPCGSMDTIRDYYNPESARYYKNKNGLENEIRSKLDKSLIKDENGYLTFRYLVNCRGETGWFVSDGVDFNYQPKQFDKILHDHLFSILDNWGPWHPVNLSGKKQDAYMYITFKIKDGEITDILP